VTDDFWEKINLISKAYYQPGRFVTFPGYEWRGNTPLGGDRNVFFISEGGRISHSCTDLLPGNATAFDISLTARDLFHDLKNSKVKPFVFAHVGGRYADMVMHDKEIELAVEVHSAWGTFEWLVEDALKRGYRIGIVANSDDHKCRPGASYPGSGQFGSLGGLTCVLAKSLERESVYQALKARHCYATTGNRPLLDVHLITSDGRRVTMGDIINHVNGIPILQVSVTGTAPLESIDVRNGLETIKSIRSYQANDLGNRIKIVWSGAEVPGRERMTRWDGNLTIRDNAIVKATPINFWNANQPLLQTGRKRLDWKSNTTGGLSGIIVELERRETGQVEVETVQRKLIVDVQSIGIEPVTFECGGLKKMIEIYRLPKGRGFTESNFELPLNDMHEGDNPIYVRIVQEDGHMAWSSPIYLMKV